MPKKKIVQFALIFALAGTLLLSMVPVAADSPTPTPEPSPPIILSTSEAIDLSAAQALPAEPVELVELRTATAKQYQLSSGLRRLEVSDRPIHYQAADGTWQEIDLRPVARPDGGFEVTTSDFKMSFPPTLADGGMAVNAAIYLPPPQLQSQTADDPWADYFAASQEQTPPPTPLTAQLSLTWQPLTGATTPAESDGIRVTYGDLSVQPLADGFVQELQLAAPPDTLEYNVYLELPEGVELNTTDNTIRDAAGNVLLVLPPPQLSDQAGSTASLEYRIEPAAGGGFLLTIALPQEWLNDPARDYPVVLAAGAVSPSALPSFAGTFTQDAWMWECAPNGGLFTQTMHVGNRSDGGSCTGGAERALMQWNISALPANAMMGFPPGSGAAVLEGTTESRLWRLPLSDTGTSGVTIATHRMITSWTAISVTWLTRTGASAWSNPGGDDNYFATEEVSTTLPVSSTPGYVSMGDLADVVGAWHTNQVAGCPNPLTNCEGDPNHGVIYKSVDETATNLDRVFARGVLTPALLQIEYFTTRLTPLPNQSFLMPRAPSPDLFQVNAISAGSAGWRAVGIQAAESRADNDLFVFNSGGTVIAKSNIAGTVPDFVMIDPSVTDVFYPFALPWEGTGPYYIKYGTSQGALTASQNLLRTSAITASLDPDEVLKVYEVSLNADTQYTIQLKVTGGDGDLGLALFAPVSAGGSQYTASPYALKRVDNRTPGGGEVIQYTPTTSGLYGLVVWNNGSETNVTTAYDLSLRTNISYVYLPAILKNYTPPTTSFGNGGFETGALPPIWIDGGVGLLSPKVVNNPDTSCFAGAKTAQLGTPDKLRTVPVGEAYMEQHFNLPADATQLTLKYQLFSYDVIRGASTERYYDRFNISINGTPVITAGNPAGSSNGKTLWESGCQTQTIDLTPYAGENITLKFSLFNLTFERYNSWAFVDNIAVQ
jgi:hypothetical protein